MNTIQNKLPLWKLVENGKDVLDKDGNLLTFTKYDHALYARGKGLLNEKHPISIVDCNEA
jgi:hypothetical protein